MAGWEDELAALLRELGVKQEKAETPLQQRGRSIPQPDDTQQRDSIADVLPWSAEQAAGFAEDDSTWVDDLTSMRREVDAIVDQVILLMQRGGLEISLKEDIMVVLRALRRRVLSSQALASHDEASYLESATAMLHFCRLVLQLSETATEQD